MTEERSKHVQFLKLKPLSLFLKLGADDHKY